MDQKQNIIVKCNTAKDKLDQMCKAESMGALDQLFDQTINLVVQLFDQNYIRIKEEKNHDN